MNPILLPVAELKPALTGLAKTLNMKSSLTVLSAVKVERTREGWITLTTSDLHRFITVRFEHPSEGKPTALLIPFQQLQDLAKNCQRNERLEIHQTPEGTVIHFPIGEKAGESKVKPLPLDKYPDIPRIKADPVVLPPPFKQCIHEALQCASSDDTRKILNGAFIDASNPKAQYIVGTDGKHLYSANSFSLPIKDSVVIPDHKFLSWRDFNLDGEWQMRVAPDIIQISSRRWRFISKQLEGQYPNWRQVVPEQSGNKTVITIDPSAIASVTQLIQRLPYHEEQFRKIGIEWHNGQLRFMSKGDRDEPWERTVVSSAKGQGNDITIFCDRRLLLKALGYGLNNITLTEHLSPLRFHSEGKQMIVMPLRPNESDQAPASSSPAPPHRPLQMRPPLQPQPPSPQRMTTPPPLQAPTASGEKSVIEECIDLCLAIRDKFSELGLKLKLANREQKTTAREMQSVRSTLRSLQGLRI